MKNQSPEIDLLEIFYFLKGKKLSIISAMIAALMLAILFLWLEKDKVSIRYEIGINNNSPSMIVNCNMDFYCKSNYIESIIKNNSTNFSISSNNKSQTITLTWKGNRKESQAIENEVILLKKQISNWYIKDYLSYKKIMNDSRMSFGGTELYTKLAIVTNLEIQNENDFISIHNGSVENIYKKTMAITLSLLLGVILSCSYHLFKKSILEYKNNKPINSQ